MTQPKTVDGKVLEILRDCPEARYNDMLLFCRYYNRYSCPPAGELPLSELARSYKEYGLPCFETIRRTRQKLQALFPEVLRKETAKTHGAPVVVLNISFGGTDR